MNEGGLISKRQQAHIFYNISVYKGIMDGGKLPATQLIYTPFHCAKLRRNAILTSIRFFPEAGQRAAEESDQEVVFDCAEKKLCGVCMEWGRFRSYNWELCFHPQLKKGSPG